MVDETVSHDVTGVGTKRPEAKFVSGWFTQQFEAGNMPDNRCPQNGLPPTTSESMEMVTGYLSARPLENTSEFDRAER